MTLTQLSFEYRAHADALNGRIKELTLAREQCGDELEITLLDERIHMLTTMLREARELAVLTARYYERGYRRNAKYTL